MEHKDNNDLITMSEFLQSAARTNPVEIQDLFDGDYLNIPTIQLHCNTCKGIRNYKCKSSNSIYYERIRHLYLKYTCSNCEEDIKVYSLFIHPDKNIAYKFGEFPSFSPPTPTKLMNLIGGERDNFLKGRRCENQGLGIAAFTYYRRVIENQKNKILQEILKVSRKLGVSSEKLNKLEDAIKENQFTKALELAKDALPESLLINGHNPLKLLYRALSEGVHNLSDEECLDLAQDIRIVLGELSEKLSQLLKEDSELTNAISRLANLKNK